MPMYILDNPAGIGSGNLDTNEAFVDLAIIANDGGIGLDGPVNGKRKVTYNRTMNGALQLRLDALVNTIFTPDYGNGPRNVDIIVIPGLHGFTLADGSHIENNGTTLPPASSRLPGANHNPTEFCLVIYDTKQNTCSARAGTNGELNLPNSNPVVLYHEFSHTFRIVNNNTRPLTNQCNPASPEEHAAINDENVLRLDLANRQDLTPELRDPNIHCGRDGCDSGNSGCCIIATVASKSLTSPQVQYFRFIRDHFVRSTEVGYAFFKQFFYDYYAFSPQVCTIMAGHPSISEHLLEGYVNPLLEFWKIMIERSRHQFRDVDLGAAFVRHHPDLAQTEARLDALHRTNTYWLNQDSNSSEVSFELIALLRERAWPSKYIQWTLVTPIRIYHHLLTLFLDGADEQTIGREFNRALEFWIPEVPISIVWVAGTSCQGTGVL
ncbi:CFI-box-CTERM domain-containing protein [Paenibacillus elgii]|uniref:CFI-box-CTERM domain-containing protein n=1 Tax=Paenibacillus elgii TaxID=189691 RepID=UPI000248DAD6|nr:CFI-box-CTERM domain-containing protein [Paenibacillus elgii]